jgi:hypothetical protein
MAFISSLSSVSCVLYSEKEENSLLFSGSGTDAMEDGTVISGYVETS